MDRLVAFEEIDDGPVHGAAGQTATRGFYLCALCVLLRQTLAVRGLRLPLSLTAAAGMGGGGAGGMAARWPPHRASLWQRTGQSA